MGNCRHTKIAHGVKSTQSFCARPAWRRALKRATKNPGASGPWGGQAKGSGAGGSRALWHAGLGGSVPWRTRNSAREKIGARGPLGFGASRPWGMQAICHAVLEAFGPWGMQALGHSGVVASGPWAMLALGHAGLGPCWPRDMRPMGHARLGACLPCGMRALVEAGFGALRPGGIRALGHAGHGACGS